MAQGKSVAYYKLFKLGDWVERPPERSVLGASPIEGDTLASRAGTISDAFGGSTRIAITVHGIFRKTSIESHTDFASRVNYFINNARYIKGVLPNDRDSIGHLTAQGSLAYVLNETTDITTTTGPVSVGSAAAIPLTADIGAGVGDYIYISDSTKYEVVQVQDFVSSSLTIEANLTKYATGTYASGATVAKVLWWAKGCYVRSDITFPFEKGLGYEVSEPVTFEFVTVEDIVQ